MQIGLSALSFSYSCGLIGRGTRRMVSQPLGLDGLIALASRAGLAGLEFPFAMLHDTTPTALAELRAQLESCHLTPVLDSEVASFTSLSAQIPIAAALGARIIRVLVSPVREGNRSTLSHSWEDQLTAVITQLRRAVPLAEEYNLVLSVENHQDATAADLLRICMSVGSDSLGVTFDPINALAVAEDPFEVLQALGHLVHNVHLSDFAAYPSPQGYRLVRCALGEGDLNFRQLFARLAQLAPDAICQIELVGHSSRHVRLLQEEWWRGYGPRDIRSLLPVLQLLAQSARPSTNDWRTPWERGAGESAVAFYEDQQFASSIGFLRSLGMLERDEI